MFEGFGNIYTSAHVVASGPTVDVGGPKPGRSFLMASVGDDLSKHDFVETGDLILSISFVTLSVVVARCCCWGLLGGEWLARRAFRVIRACHQRDKGRRDSLVWDAASAHQPL
jgi:hypothetical protein